MKVYLNEHAKATKFVNVANTFEEYVDAIMYHYVIDAKSLMGIFTLDLSQPIEVKIHSDNPEVLSRFTEAMKEFEI